MMPIKEVGCELNKCLHIRQLFTGYAHTEYEIVPLFSYTNVMLVLYEYFNAI